MARRLLRVKIEPTEEWTDDHRALLHTLNRWGHGYGEDAYRSWHIRQEFAESEDGKRTPIGEPEKTSCLSSSPSQAVEFWELLQDQD